MASVAARLDIAVSASLEKPLAIGRASYPLRFVKTQNIAAGTGAGRANMTCIDTRSLGPSAFEDLDLAGGLTNAFGLPIAFAQIKMLSVQADAGNANDVVIGGAAGDAATAFFGAAADQVKVKPGGLVYFMAPDANGYAITAQAGSLLRLRNGGDGSSVTFTITAIGVETPADLGFVTTNGGLGFVTTNGGREIVTREIN